MIIKNKKITFSDDLVKQVDNVKLRTTKENRINPRDPIEIELDPGKDFNIVFKSKDDLKKSTENSQSKNLIDKKKTKKIYDINIKINLVSTSDESISHIDGINVKADKAIENLNIKKPVSILKHKKNKNNNNNNYEYNSSESASPTPPSTPTTKAPSVFDKIVNLLDGDQKPTQINQNTNKSQSFSYNDNFKQSNSSLYDQINDLLNMYDNYGNKTDLNNNVFDDNYSKFKNAYDNAKSSVNNETKSQNSSSSVYNKIVELLDTKLSNYNPSKMGYSAVNNIEKSNSRNIIYQW